MFSDTHFHFHMMITERGLNGPQILTDLAARDFKFGLDIGTGRNDLEQRQACVEETINQMADKTASEKARNFMYYSAGIWPNIEDIHDRENAMKDLRQSIQGKKIVAIGECGLDHHWNPSGADGRCESDFDEKTYKGEKELFQMQLEFAKELKLPVIIHSRDAFEDTLDCLKNVGYHNGIVHCYSYGIEEAKKFLDLGWYIAFGGATTYTKKAKLDDMKALLQFVPEDRFLCETDAPYLAPVPFRGQSNNPVLVEEVYKFIAQLRGTTPEALSELVDENIDTLFFAKGR